MVKVTTSMHLQEENVVMYTTQLVRCPNCGSKAQRYFLTGDQVSHLKCPSNQVTQVECPHCDYLMVTCSLNGSVKEAHSPGIAPQTIDTKASCRLPLPSPVPELSVHYWQSSHAKQILTISKS